MCHRNHDPDMALKRCQRCGAPFHCHEEKDCWCESARLHRRELVVMMESYSDCLCPDCLSAYETD